MTLPQASPADAGSGTHLGSRIRRPRARDEASQDPLSDHTRHFVMIAEAKKDRRELPAEGPKGPRAAMKKQICATYGIDDADFSRLVSVAGRIDGPCVINAFLRRRLAEHDEPLDVHLRKAGTRFKDLVNT